MKVITKGQIADQDATSAPIFFGGKVSRQPLIASEDSKFFKFGIVKFEAGARNKLHTHTSDQILFVTSGTGIVGTAEREVVVEEGDAILILAGEKHWHGATADSDFAHVVVLTNESKTEIFE